jgi:SseB protein N-terminal domain
VDLNQAIVRFHLGLLPPRELTAVFLRSTLWCERRGSTGATARGRPGRGYLLAFSSPAELARYGAKFPDRHADGVDWLSTSGADLVDLLPDGYGLALDVAGDYPVALPAAALRRVLVIRADAVSG